MDEFDNCQELAGPKGELLAVRRADSNARQPFFSAFLSLLFAAACVAALSPASAQTETQRNTTTLSQLRNHARLLLIFSPSENETKLQHQLAIMTAAKAEATERDLVTIAITKDTTWITPTRLTDADITSARLRFHVDSDQFTLILVGKDGGEKLRQNEPVSFDRLREVIDAMPMRREEMKAKNH